MTDPTDPNRASYAALDKSGKYIAGYNADKPVEIASLAKLVTLWYVKHLEQNGQLKQGFIDRHAPQIAAAMNNSDNEAAKAIAKDAETELGITHKQFMDNMNGALKNINIAGHQVLNTHITSPAGGDSSQIHGASTSTMWDMAAILHDLNSKIKLDKFHNTFQPEVFNCPQCDFVKPGWLNDDGVRAAGGILKGGGEIAVAVERPGESSDRLNQLLKNGIIEASGARGSLAYQGISLGLSPKLPAVRTR